MAAPKGLLAILTAGKSKKPPMSGDEGDESEEMAEDGADDSVGHRAAQDVIDAIGAKDAAGLYEALERVVKACQGESEAE